jgi:hypothetical protein
MKTVFVAEFISEDTNPWDSRERYGIFTTIEAATESVSKFVEDDNWKPLKGKPFGASEYGKRGVRAWKLVSAEDGDEYDDDGFGIYIWEERVD